MKIRLIEESDWPEIDRIQRVAYMPEAVEEIETIRQLWRLAPQTCLVAGDSHVSGYLIAHPWQAEVLPPLNVFVPTLPNDAETLFIHDLALEPAARGQGIAGALVEALFKRAQNLGLQSASLLSIQGTETFWKRFGFVNRPDLAEPVGKVLREFLETEFVFMTRLDLEF